MNAQTIYLLIFACIAYLIVTDQSVAKLVYYLSKIVEIQYRKFKWWIVHSPDNPIVRYFIHRRSLKMAKELEKEIKSKQ